MTDAGHEVSDAPPEEETGLEPPVVEGGRIGGRVTDFDGYPLVGVRVESVATGGADLDLLPAMTDGEGRFVLEGLAEGAYDLRFALGNVRARTLGVPTGTEELAVRLARPRGLLLIVRSPEEERPPDLLHVVIERETRRGPLREYAGRHLTSRMLFWNIRPGRYTVTVWGGAWLPVIASGVEVSEKGSAPEVELLLSARGGCVRGRVVDASGEAVGGALVGWRPVGREGPWLVSDRSTSCDDRGQFVVQGLPADTYRLSVGPQGGPFVDRDVVVEGEGDVEVEVTLPTG